MLRRQERLAERRRCRLESRVSHVGNDNHKVLSGAICDIFGMTPPTKKQRRRVGGLAKEFGELDTTPYEIRIRADRHRAAWPDWEWTPESVLKHWDRFDDEETHERSRMHKEAAKRDLQAAIDARHEEYNKETGPPRLTPVIIALLLFYIVGVLTDWNQPFVIVYVFLSSTYFLFDLIKSFLRGFTAPLRLVRDIESLKEEYANRSPDYQAASQDD